MTDRTRYDSEAPSCSGGYKQPPLKRRFKGSGNPKGRPKGSKNRKTIVRMIANETHAVVENGQRRRRSTLELVLLRLRNMALENKNTRAFDEYHRLCKKYDAKNDDSGGCLVVPAPMTEEEWTAREIEENKTRKPPAGYEGR